MRRLASWVMAVMLAAAWAAPAQPRWQVLQEFHVGGDGGWDYATFDPAAHRLFVTRATHTMVIDAKSGEVLADIPGQIRSHGVALVPRLNRGFITDGGGTGAILIFDLRTYRVLGRIAAMPDADGIVYDAPAGKILAVSGDGGALMTLDPAVDPGHGTIDPPIALGGAPEFLAAGEDGKVFVNLEDKDQVAVVDLHSRRVTARWPVAPGGHPVGLALDRQRHQLIVGCRNPQKMIVMDSESGKILAAVPIGAGVDATAVLGELALASCRDGSLVLVDRAKGRFQAQVVQDPEGARTMAVDPEGALVYLPTAQLESSGGGRPQAKPGTFEIVVVGRR